MVDTVLSGVVSTAPYAVANQLINTRLRAIEVERKIKETDQLESRIEELERAGGGVGRKGERSWEA
jgi:5-enolpyruvylshikimate-3-phosphate synthase